MYLCKKGEFLLRESVVHFQIAHDILRRYDDFSRILIVYLLLVMLTLAVMTFYF